MTDCGWNGSEMMARLEVEKLGTREAREREEGSA